MARIFSFGVLALMCLGVVILTMLVIIFALRRGTRKINEQVDEITSRQDGSADGNTRWARGNLADVSPPPAPEKPMLACPACGGENEAGASVCSFCGSKL